MRITVTLTNLIILGLVCSSAPYSHAATPAAPASGCSIAGPEDPSVDGDLEGILLRIEGPKSTPATSDCVAPDPSKCAEPALPEVRPAPADGQTVPRFPEEEGDVA